MHKKKLLFVQPYLDRFGGGTMVAAAMLEALVQRYSITIITCLPFSVNKINEFCGTSLVKSDLTAKILPRPVRVVFDHFPNDPKNFLRICLLMRWCRLIGKDYDIVMTAHNEMDFGRRGIQYLHHPTRHDNWRVEKDLREDSRRQLIPFRYHLERLRTWRLVSGFSFNGMSRNVTIVNSRWTARRFKEIYGLESKVIYPPVRNDFPQVPWKDREKGFVCIGRISKDKQMEDVIDILLELRNRGADLHLNIIGSKETYQSDYYERVKGKVSQHSSWVSLREGLSREELVNLVARHRYGIHGMENEHFGIAVAEMVFAGCIPFIPNGGGQVEIVGHNPSLIYRDKSDAVRKILDLIQNPDMENRIREYLDSRRSHFSKEGFVSQMRTVVSDFEESEYL